MIEMIEEEEKIQWLDEIQKFYRRTGWIVGGIPQEGEDSPIDFVVLKGDTALLIKAIVCHSALIDLSHLIDTPTHVAIRAVVNARVKGRLFIKYMSADGKLSSHYLTWEQVLVALSSGTGKISILDTLPLEVLCAE